MGLSLSGGSLCNEDELFYICHNPVAEDECHIMLIERKTTLHTGDVITNKTRSVEEQLR